MKYLFSFLLFLLTVYLFELLNWFGGQWTLIMPHLILVLLIFFNTEDHWLVYSAAVLSGLYLDAVSAASVYAVSLLGVIFILSILRYTMFTAKSIFSVVVMTCLGELFFWLIFFSLNYIFGIHIYFLNTGFAWLVLRRSLLAAVLVIFLHTIFYNLWTRRQYAR